MASATVRSHPDNASVDKEELKGSTPLVSIVMPVFNQVAYTRQCLQSILNNPPSISFEIIVVDDASTDNSRDLLHADYKDNPCVRIVENETNMGFAKSCNQGAKAAGGEYILFLNNDTEPLSDWLSPLVNVLEHNPDIGIVGPKLIFPDRTIQHCGKVWQDPGNPDSQPEHIYYREPADAPHVNRSRDYQMITGACMLVRKSEFFTIGPFDEEYLNGWEDDDLCYAYRAQGKRVFYCAASEVVHHQSKTLGVAIHKTLDMLSLYEKKRAFVDPTGNAVEGNEKVVSFLDDKLSVNRARFDRNRKRFFDKWGNMVVRDDFTYYREDGLTDRLQDNNDDKSEDNLSGTELKDSLKDLPASMDIPTKTTPSVSIIIPVFNCLEYTRNCLDAIAKHTPEEKYEIVIVDNGSTDGTNHFLKTLKGKVTIISNEKNLGFARACNQGAKTAAGEHLLFLNNDTEPTPGWLEPLLSVFETDKNAGIVGNKLIYPDGTIQHAGVAIVKDAISHIELCPHHYGYKKTDSQQFNYLKQTYAVSAACMMIRNTIFHLVGGFDERFWNGYEDVDLCFKVLKSAHYIYYQPESVVVHHESKSGVNRTNKEQQNLMLLQEKWAGLITPEFITMEHNVFVPYNFASIIIVTFNSEKTIYKCLDSVAKYIRPYDVVIIVDNNSKDETVKVIKQFTEKTKQFKFIQNITNMGFSAGTNIGIAHSSNPFIVLLNPDTIVTENWLNNLSSHFTGHDIAAVGPVSNYVAERQKMELYQKTEIPPNATPDEIALKFYAWNQRTSVESKLLIGFCMMIRRDVVKELGPLDENLFLGNDDLELCWRFRVNGYRLKIATDTFIHHDGQQSFMTEIKEKTTRLVQKSTDALYLKLQSFYGGNSVPTPEELWGIDWFSPSSADFNPDSGLQNVIRKPDSKTCTPRDIQLQHPVSIIILTFNQLDYTKECIENIRRHTPDPYEIIFIDNGSSDGTVDWLRHLVDRKNNYRLVENGMNLGFAKACNQGAKAASFKYLLFLNNDTEPFPGWLEPLVTVLERDDSVAAVGSKLLFPDGTIQHAGILTALVKDRERPDILMAANMYTKQPSDFIKANYPSTYQSLTAACLLIRKSAFHDVGGFDEEYWNGCEDIDLCFKLRQKGWKLVYQPESVLLHHEAQSGDERFRKVDENIERLHNKWHGTIKPDIIIGNDGECIETDARHIQAYTIPEASNQKSPAASFFESHTKVSIVILTFNQLDYTRQCIASLQRHTPEPHEVIFVDNGSNDGTVDWLRGLLHENGNYRLIENRQNLGFARGCNQGIEAASGDYILLLNNDVIVTPEWLSGMLECYSHIPDAGIVGPMTNNISGVQKVPRVEYGSLERLDDFAREFRRENRRRRIPMRRVVGFCMLFRRTLVDKIGPLDETFGTGNFEDDDLCYRAALEGYRNIIAADVFIHHFGSVSFFGNNIDFAAAMTANMGLFNQKWHIPDLDDATALKALTVRTLEKGEALFQRWELDRAVDVILQEGIKYAPDDRRFYYLLAEHLLDAKRFTDALEIVNEIPEEVQEGRRFALAGYCKEGMGAHQEAAELAALALALEPDSPLALNLKGTIAYRSGDRGEAEEFFRKAIDSDPGYGEPYTNLGVLKWTTGERREALGLFERGFMLSPLLTDVANSYHSAICELGELVQGERLFGDVKRFFPHSRGIVFFLIDILIQQGKHREAMKEIEAALVNFGADDGMVVAALQVREEIGPLEIANSSPKEREETVSLCMIVKNEEKELPKALLSLKPLVDEMIVVDTGSEDLTKEIATIFGAKVFDFAWTGDFSAARNFAASKANGAWILAMDADEVISPQDYGRFNALVKNSETAPVAYEFTTRNYIKKINVEKFRPNDGAYFQEEAGAGWVPSNKARLFPNHRGIGFENPVHEMVEPSLARLSIPVERAEVPIHHYGKLNPAKDTAKGEHYYLLGIKKLKETGGDLDAICELAIQAGMLERYGEAIELWQKALTIRPDLPVAYFNMGYAHMQLNQFTESLAASKRAMELKPDFREAVSNYCIGEVYCGDVYKAIARLNEILGENPGNPGALLVLACAWCCAGEKEKGLEKFAAIMRMQIDCSAFVNDFVKKLMAAGRPAYAARLLEAALASDIAIESTIAPMEESATKVCAAL